MDRPCLLDVTPAEDGPLSFREEQPFAERKATHRRATCPRAVYLLVVLCAMSVSARSALAQRNWPYRPTRPTMSPYMNLYRTDSGVVDNYNAFVRPEIEMRNALGRQETSLARQGNDLSALQQYLSGRQRSIAGATTRASVFMNYLHYFPQPNALMSRGAVGRGRR